MNVSCILKRSQGGIYLEIDDRAIGSDGALECFLSADDKQMTVVGAWHKQEVGASAQVRLGQVWQHVHLRHAGHEGWREGKTDNKGGSNAGSI